MTTQNSLALRPTSDASCFNASDAPPAATPLAALAISESQRLPVAARNPDSLAAWLGTHPGAWHYLRRMVRLDSDERRSMLACGALVERFCKRYDREQNAGKLAELLSHMAGRPISRGTLLDRQAAFRMYRAHKRASGGRAPNVEPSKLAAIWQAGRGAFSLAEKVELCRRASERRLTKSQIRTEALRMGRAKSAGAIAHQVQSAVRHVEQMDGLNLLQGCPTESADLILLDWMYKPYAGAPNLPVANVYIPDDPVGHIVQCIDAARRALSTLGAIALFSDHRSDPDPRIAEALRRCGLRRVDQYILHQARGGFSSSRGALFSSMHETIDFYRRADIELPVEHLRYEPSVSPKWRIQSREAVCDATVHPFEKPVEVFERFIGVTTVGGLVLDPFAGTGNSGVAAVRRGCSYRGAEMVAEYVDLANRRIALATERDAETVEAINFALAGANDEQRAAILFELERVGVKIDCREVAA